jgi:hypothetical protein
MSETGDIPRWMKLSLGASALLATTAWVAFLVWGIVQIFEATHLL